jgi:bifunctional DNA-binding transcriptional regulator/antitoxin component of YhaV-PrlF toxin-antitoxin module
MVIPRSLREELGVAEGTLMKVDVIKGSQFLVTPQLTVNRPDVAQGRGNRKQLLRELAVAVDELRQDAKAKGIDKMSKREINRAVVSARQDLNKTNKRSVK